MMGKTVKIEESSARLNVVMIEPAMYCLSLVTIENASRIGAVGDKRRSPVTFLQIQCEVLGSSSDEFWIWISGNILDT